MVNDLPILLQWWLMFFLYGLISLPSTALFFRSFADAGYGFAKTLGTIVVAYLLFIGAAANIVPFTDTNVIIFSALWAIINGFLLLKNQASLIPLIKEKFGFIILQELLFTIGFIFWALVRGFSPDINGLEKFMDYGFVNAALRGEKLPPQDMWFVGYSINYYWFGHYWTAFLTRLSAIPSAITYNLMIATIAGLSLTTAFSFISTLIRTTVQKKVVRIAIAAGTIAAILLIFAGNFHTPYFGLKEGFDKYWYPDATRFIGHNPETEDKTIHEFPLYSFVVADLHAHLINLPIVLMYIAAIWMISQSPVKKRLVQLPFLGFLLGIMFMTSTWDFGNYTILTGFVFLFMNFRKYKFTFQTIWQTVVDVTIPLATGVLTALIFILNFDSIAQGIKFVHTNTPIWQLAILWGFPAVLTIIFVATLLKNRKHIAPSDIFILAMHATGWVLIALPEIFYVKDIYVASHYRANTMFKLTYQAFVLFYLSSGYIAIRTLLLTRNMFLKGLLFALFALVFTSIMTYPPKAINSYYGELKNYKGLSGETWLINSRPELYNVIQWLRINAPKNSTLLEASGDSYTEYNVVSSYTGIPTINGWFVHEWLWRGTADIPQARVSDIEMIYTTSDTLLAQQLLEKYQIDFVLVGQFERERYPSIQEEKFKAIGKKVFSSGVTTLYQINPND